MRNVERQTSMRYATGTSENWRWSRDALLVSFQELIHGAVQQHPQTNKLKGVGISLDPPDWQLIWKMKVSFFLAKTSGWGRDVLPPAFLSPGILLQLSPSQDELHSWVQIVNLPFHSSKVVGKKAKNYVYLCIQHIIKELQKLGEFKKTNYT